MTWQLYDDLIGRVPGDIFVSTWASSDWSIVTTECGLSGVAMTLGGGSDDQVARVHLSGAPLCEIATLVKSWDLRLASLGTAALNAWYNTATRITDYPHIERGSTSTFALHAPKLVGHAVAAIGHFADIDKYQEQFDPIVIERSPHGADLPDSACEYVLSDRDDIYITGSALTNKTLPRLLELSAHARVVLVGPSVPFAPEVFGSAVAEIGGAYVSDRQHCLDVIADGNSIRELRRGLHHFNVTFDGGLSARGNREQRQRDEVDTTERSLQRHHATAERRCKR